MKFGILFVLIYGVFNGYGCARHQAVHPVVCTFQLACGKQAKPAEFRGDMRFLEAHCTEIPSITREVYFAQSDPRLDSTKNKEVAVAAVVDHLVQISHKSRLDCTPLVEQAIEAISGGKK